MNVPSNVQEVTAIVPQTTCGVHFVTISPYLFSFGDVSRQNLNIKGSFHLLFNYWMRSVSLAAGSY